MSAERWAWRKGWGETAAKMGRGKVRAGGGAEAVVAIVCICVRSGEFEVGDVVLEILELELLHGARVKLKSVGRGDGLITTTTPPPERQMKSRSW